MKNKKIAMPELIVPVCSYCKKPWTEHPGIAPTCAENKELRDKLRECAEVLRTLLRDQFTKPGDWAKAAALLAKLEERKG